MVICTCVCNCSRTLRSPCTPAWRKSRASSPSGSRPEVATLPDGEIAVRNSRHPSGPALIYTRAEIAAFLAGAKDGKVDDLT